MAKERVEIAIAQPAKRCGVMSRADFRAKTTFVAGDGFLFEVFERVHVVLPRLWTWTRWGQPIARVHEMREPQGRVVQGLPQVGFLLCDPIVEGTLVDPFAQPDPSEPRCGEHDKCQEPLLAAEARAGHGNPCEHFRCEKNRDHRETGSCDIECRAVDPKSGDEKRGRRHHSSADDRPSKHPAKDVTHEI